MSRYCTVCGAKVDQKKDKFCQECGTFIEYSSIKPKLENKEHKLDDQRNYPPQTYYEFQPYQPVKQSNLLKILTIVIILLFIGFVIILPLYTIFNDGSLLFDDDPSNYSELYGSLQITYEMKNLTDSTLIEVAGPVYINYDYTEEERERTDMHFSTLFAFPQNWWIGDYRFDIIYSDLDMNYHYVFIRYTEGVNPMYSWARGEDGTEFTYTFQISSNGQHPRIANITIWESGTGPMPDA